MTRPSTAAISSNDGLGGCAAPAPNLFHRNFRTHAPNEAWVGDNDVDINCANTPAAKGWVQRANTTLRVDRLATRDKRLLAL